MAVAHDAVSESHTGAVGSISQASFSWTHTPVGTPRGVLIFVMGLVTANDDVTSITYGGITVPAVAGGFAQDTATEPMSCKAFFLGSGVPTGAQTVLVNRNNNTNELWATAITVTADVGHDTGTTGVVLLQEDGTLSEQSVNDGSPGSNSVRYAGIASGLASPPGAGASSTLRHVFDTGNQTASSVQETTAGQGARNVGFSSGTSDDRAAVHLAVKEVGAAVALASVSAAVSTAAGALAVKHTLAGVSAAISTAASALAVKHTLQGASGALSTASGTLAVKRPLAGLSEALSTVVVALAVRHAISGESASLSTASGAIVLKLALLVLSGSLSTTTGALGVRYGLTGSSAGVSTASGALSIVGATGRTARRGLLIV